MHLADYFLPSVAVVLVIITIIIIWYFWKTFSCLFCSHRSEFCKINDLQARMNKIETFSQYFICSSFFDLETEDIKKKFEQRQLSKYEKATEGPEDNA